MFLKSILIEPTFNSAKLVIFPEFIKLVKELASRNGIHLKE